MNSEGMGLHIVVIGNPISGFSFTGPFNNAPEAIEAAERLFPNEDWWVAPLWGEEGR